MKATLLLLCTALFCLLLAPTAQAQDRTQETKIDERFAVSEGGTLEVNVGDAHVEVQPGVSDEVHVTVILEGRDMERARDYFERQRFEVRQQGNTVRIETDPRRRIQMGWRDWRDHPQIYVTVTIPTRFDADIHTSDGDITLERLEGDATLKTSDGDVTVGAITGRRIMLSTSDGDIRLDEINGNTVDIHTSDGTLDLGAITADLITARTSDGDIAAGRLDGEAELKTSDGDIRVEAATGPAFGARTSDGEITIGELIAEMSTVRTSDGAITIRHVEGDLNVSGSSADIRLDVQRAGEVSATTSDGDITIIVPASLRADVHLRGDDVRVSSQLDFGGRLDDDVAEGTINGGGPLIKARTSDGDVTLRGNF